MKYVENMSEFWYSKKINLPNHLTLVSSSSSTSSRVSVLSSWTIKKKPSHLPPFCGKAQCCSAARRRHEIKSHSMHSIHFFHSLTVQVSCAIWHFQTPNLRFLDLFERRARRYIYIYIHIEINLIRRHYSRVVWTPKKHMLQHLILQMFEAFASQSSAFVCICCCICLHLLWHLFWFVLQCFTYMFANILAKPWMLKKT